MMFCILAKFRANVHFSPNFMIMIYPNLDHLQIA